MASDKAKLRQFAKEYAEKRARAAQLQQEAAEQRRLVRARSQPSPLAWLQSCQHGEM